MKHLRPWLWGALTIALGGPASGEPFRTLIMVDASSSMRQTDPQRLRKVAAELYVDLAREGDYIAVSQFDAAAKDVSGGFQKITGPEVRSQLKAAIRAIGDDGEWTDFGAAFSAAGQAFGPPPPFLYLEKRFLVFLTDGRCEPAPGEARYQREGDRGPSKLEERENRCKQFVLSRAIPEMKAVEAEVVGLSRGAPKEFLQQAARQTGGRAVVTERAEDLPRLFAQIHAFNSGARAAEPKNGEILVDKLVSSLDLAIVAGRDVELKLLRPGGQELSLDELGVYSARADLYRVFHVPRPAPGTWSLKGAKRLGPGAVTAIQHFDLRLELRVAETATAGQPIEIQEVLAAGEGGGMPEESFLSRHRFLAFARAEGATRELPLTAEPGGARAGRFTVEKPGTVEIWGRVEPGPEGALTRVAPSVRLAVVPPLKLAFAAPFLLGELKPGTTVKRSLDLGDSELTGEVKLEVKTQDMTLDVHPKRLVITEREKRFDVSFEVPASAEPGPVSGAVALLPASKPYVGRAGPRIPVVAVIIPRSFLENHGGKLLLLAVFALFAAATAGFMAPARFSEKSRLHFEDRFRKNSGDFDLALRCAPGFYKPATFKLGGGGPIRPTSPLLCEIVAARGGARVRPAPGRLIRTPDGSGLSTPFRPAPGVKYEADEGLFFWVSAAGS